MDTLVRTKKERFWNPEAWQRDNWVREQAKRIPAGSYVLDAGAGASKYRPFFAHCKYETQDFCQYEGELVKYLQPVDHVCEITRIPLVDESLDAILCTEVLEHVVDPMAVLAEFSRLLRPGGRLLLTAPHASTVHMEPYHFYAGFTHYWYRHWLPEKGFSIESITAQGGPGRAAVSFLHAYYTTWRGWEQEQPGFARVLSLACRMIFKFPFHYLFPRLFPRLDRHVDCQRMCIGFMVAATKLAKPHA